MVMVSCDTARIPEVDQAVAGGVAKVPGVEHTAQPAAEGGLLLDPDRATGLGQHPVGHRRGGRGGARNGETGQDRIYDRYPDVRLDLVESRAFEGGLQLLEYVPTVLDGPAV